MFESSTTTDMLFLEPDNIHIWVIQLSTYDAKNVGHANDTFLKLTANLSAVELDRAKIFSRPEARHRYLQVRSEVRNCLARYTGMLPSELHLEPNALGKPRLKNASTPLEFNLSHSGDYLALAVSAGADIGIDLERASERRNWQAIAKRFFHPDELAQLLALPEAQRPRAFYQLWTLKEAFFKARGTGIATGLEKVVFDLRGKKIHYRFSTDLKENGADWQFQQGQWEHKYHLAIACRAPYNQLLKPIFYQRKLTNDQRLSSAATMLSAPPMTSSA